MLLQHCTYQRRQNITPVPRPIARAAQHTSTIVTVSETRAEMPDQLLSFHCQTTQSLFIQHSRLYFALKKRYPIQHACIYSMITVTVGSWVYFNSTKRHAETSVVVPQVLPSICETEHEYKLVIPYTWQCSVTSTYCSSKT